MRMLEVQIVSELMVVVSFCEMDVTSHSHLDLKKSPMSDVCYVITVVEMSPLLYEVKE